MAMRGAVFRLNDPFDAAKGIGRLNYFEPDVAMPGVREIAARSSCSPRAVALTARRQPVRATRLGYGSLDIRFLPSQLVAKRTGRRYAAGVPARASWNNLKRRSPAAMTR